MSVLGIVSEYNPFHNGHKYHIEKSKELCGADTIVSVMSGNFIQRGEPAIVNKWARAEMALQSGVDLVIELPVLYAMSSAEFFAFGAVKILDSLGVVDFISFGSEAGNIDELQNVSNLLIDESEEFKAALKEALDKGVKFPNARSQALEKVTNTSFSDNLVTTSPTNKPTKVQSSNKLSNHHKIVLGNNTSSTFNSFNSSSSSSSSSHLLGSNNILAIEYLKALSRIGSKIQPITVKRAANAYNQQELSGSISSATAIRASLKEDVSESLINKSFSNITSNITTNITFNKTTNKTKNTTTNTANTLALDEQIISSMPEFSTKIIEREFLDGRGPIFPQNYENIILSHFRSQSKEIISQLPYVSEGLENRLKECANKATSFDDFYQLASTKRYTKTRLQRIAFSVLTGATNNILVDYNRLGGPQYLRVLGHNENGRALLAKMRKKATLPIITKLGGLKLTEAANKMLEMEILATDNYVLAYKNPDFRRGGQDFLKGPIII